jgi:hypothetical protein
MMSNYEQIVGSESLGIMTTLNSSSYSAVGSSAALFAGLAGATVDDSWQIMPPLNRCSYSVAVFSGLDGATVDGVCSYSAGGSSVAVFSGLAGATVDGSGGGDSRTVSCFSI